MSRLIAILIGVTCTNFVCGQVLWTKEDVVRIVRHEWQQLGDSLEIKLNIKRNASANMSAYGFEPINTSASAMEATWYFSGNNYFRADSLISVVDGQFTRQETACLNGDFEQLGFHIAVPTQLDLRTEEREFGIWCEFPFVQMYYPRYRKDVLNLLAKATIEAGTIDSEPVMIASATEQAYTWKYFFAQSDRFRLLRVTSERGGNSIQCNFTYRDDAKSWADLARWTSETYSGDTIDNSASFDVQGIIKHTSLPDEIFRVARPENVLVIDHEEHRRRKRLGETKNLALEVAPSVPPSWRFGYWGYLLILASIVGGTVLYFYRRRA